MMAPATATRNPDTEPQDERETTVEQEPTSPSKPGIGELSRLPRELFLMILEYVPNLEYKPVFSKALPDKGRWPIYVVPTAVLQSCRTLNRELTRTTDRLNERYPATVVVTLDTVNPVIYPLNLGRKSKMASEYDRHWLKSIYAHGRQQQAQIGRWVADVPTGPAVRNWGMRAPSGPSLRQAQSLRAFLKITVLRLRRHQRLRVIQLAPPTRHGMGRTESLLERLCRDNLQDARAGPRPFPAFSDLDCKVLLPAPNDVKRGVEEHAMQPETPSADSQPEHFLPAVSSRYVLDEGQHLFVQWRAQLERGDGTVYDLEYWLRVVRRMGSAGASTDASQHR
ncbi:hypothetical protein P171DRAFT_430695 [Karstenula rhodostoma CBS 690.94]|uniref:F-box domain-containing protein n=1 Tax=Karstenula rhodostoma CBS 690.94 TaxID=1392251 RepID=A0A9P4PNV9_9PLEO|nr:hypothetical protein P171DRAFT_430695 [Karstenula rhodostoma CBS 690.94]